MKKYEKVPGESKFWRWLKGIHPCALRVGRGRSFTFLPLMALLVALQTFQSFRRSAQQFR